MYHVLVNDWSTCFAGAAINNGLLVMATGSILLPSTLAATGTQSCGNKNCKGSELALSRFESLFLLGVYTLYLVFQLITHRYLYEGDQEGDREGSSQKDENNLDREGRVRLNLLGYSSTALWSWEKYISGHGQHNALVWFLVNL